MPATGRKQTDIYGGLTAQGFDWGDNFLGIIDHGVIGMFNFSRGLMGCNFPEGVIAETYRIAIDSTVLSSNFCIVLYLEIYKALLTA